MSSSTTSLPRAERQRLYYEKQLDRQRKRCLTQDLKQDLAAQGMKAPERSTPTNRRFTYPSIAAEQADRQETTDRYLQALRQHLPVLLKRLAKIRDVRTTNKIKHSMSVVLFTGLLMFLLQKQSRREANRELATASLLESLNCVFPELKTMPHQDTVKRLLQQIDVLELEAAHLELLTRLIRKRRFQNDLIDGRYPIAIDGTQKAARSEPVAEEWLTKRTGSTTTYYLYVVEANFAFRNGLIVPIMSEPCDMNEGHNEKQDCEYRAFQRLAQRLKKTFPKLKCLLLLDGLFATGPIMTMLNAYHWDWMIVLKDDSLPTVWREAKALRELHNSGRHPEHYRKPHRWGHRTQQFWWVNDLEYDYEHQRPDGTKTPRRLSIHVVVCEEHWDEIAVETGDRTIGKQRFAWISNRPITHRNVHQRCNLAARYRWSIEESFLIEKHRGYHYEHLFSTNWNASIGYHLLLRLAHLINLLLFHTEHIAKSVALYGQMAFIRFIERTLTGNWLKLEITAEKLNRPYQVRNI